MFSELAIRLSYPSSRRCISEILPVFSLGTSCSLRALRSYVLGMGDNRIIVHLDLDAFYAQVEHKRLNIPRDKPLAVQQWYVLSPFLSSPLLLLTHMHTDIHTHFSSLSIRASHRIHTSQDGPDRD